MSHRFRIKNKTLEEARESLFCLNSFPKSFTEVFEIKDIKLPNELSVGCKVSMNLKKFGVSAESEYEVTELSLNKLVYKQSCGIMRKWTHTMSLKEENGTVELIDDISYEVPYGLIGHLANDLFLRTEVPSMLYKRLKYLKLK